MRRPLKVILVSLALAAVGASVAACGTEKISVKQSNAVAYTGAELFAQRCSGCHTLSYAGTHGSAAYVRDAQPNNGPNFDVRCERPITRVLYAIANGGFSGAIMPQNIVVGAQALAVAQFVATYAGQQSPRVPGVPVCSSKPIGTIPSATTTTTAPTTTTTPSSTAPATTAQPTQTRRGTAKGRGGKSQNSQSSASGQSSGGK